MPVVSPSIVSKVSNKNPACILIGPEGDFSENERQLIVDHKKTISISLWKPGPIIIRLFCEITGLFHHERNALGNGNHFPRILISPLDLGLVIINHYCEIAALFQQEQITLGK